MTTILRVGDTVTWAGAWGRQESRRARVTQIDLVEPGDKHGESVTAVPWSAVEREVVVTLDNGHWAYGYQLRHVLAPEPGDARCEDCGQGRPVRCWDGRYRCHECVRDSLAAEAGGS